MRLLPDDVLLVVDVQRDFLPGGALAVPDGDAVIAPVNRVAALFDHVLLTQDWHPADHLSFAANHPGRAPFETVELAYGTQVLWPTHCVQGTDGAEFAPGLHLPQAELVIRKGYRREVDSYSSFIEADRRTPTGLAGYLRERGLGRLFLAGLATDFCVAWSALDARRAGFEAVVLEDACRGIDTGGSLAWAWRAMAEAGVPRVDSASLSRARAVPTRLDSRTGSAMMRPSCDRGAGMARRKSIEISGFRHQNPIPNASLVGNLLMSGSIIGFDAGTRNLPPTIEGQVANMFAHMREIVQAAGGSLDDIVKVTVWLKDPSDRAALNAAWVELFPDPHSRPARHAQRLEPDSPALVSCEITALIGQG